VTRRCSRRRAVATQTEKDAEEPRPAPIGRVARAVKLNEGLRDINIYTRAMETFNETHLLLVPAMTIYKYKKAKAAALAFGCA
jgi:hypothetical protein